MAYIMSSRDPANMTVEELLKELDGFTQLAAEVAKRVSLVLAELRKRRQPHPFFRHPVLAFFQQIADERLAPEAAVALGNQHMIRAILPLAHDDQIAVAYGRNVAVARLNEKGAVVSDDVPIHRMDAATIERAFGPDGIRPVHDQAEMIRAAGRVERHGMISVLRDEVMLKIGNQKIKPEDLRGPLLALGYRLEKPLQRAATAG